MKMLLIVFLSALTTVFAEYRSHLPPTCDSPIYCYGPLLHTVQMARLYKDSKTFVDMKMKQPPNATLHMFDLLMNRTRSAPSKAEVQAFVEDNFDPEGSEFEEYDPIDWIEKPELLSRIKDEELRGFAGDLNDLWKLLGRKMKAQVRDNPELYSIIYVDHPVIVPGGRFREFYYWDSYWIVRGLLLSEMKQTVKGMLSNFLSIVERIGHIPNGGRVYYKMRSQPPMLVPMMKTYIDETGDHEFLRSSIGTMEKEFDFWMNNHTINIQRDGETYRLVRYADQSQGPRPESYREDIQSAQKLDSFDKKEEFYAELKAAAESGWDFSSRWFIVNGTNDGHLEHLKTRSIIPVDLNAIIQWNAALLSEFHGILDNRDKMQYYKNIADEWMVAIEKILWHEETGSWLDYDNHNGKKRDYFYASNISPLWTGSYEPTRREYYVHRIMKYLDNNNVDSYLGGIPTSLKSTPEQWDYPNAWAPLQHIIISGLRSAGVPAASRLAQEWAERWVRSNYRAYKKSRAMYEKYDATMAGVGGGGGEYEVQLGFGWSNSVVLDLLNMYSDMTAYEDFEDVESAETDPQTQADEVKKEIVEFAEVTTSAAAVSSILTAILVLTASLAAGILGFLTYRRRQSQPKLHRPDGVRLLRENEKPYTELKSMK